ncbi:wuschel homeobox protein [Medicago truncatula]|uniref:Wuschel homeobox protein n=1 Tax=Medicago truncatula TaxID=3880 RepID=A0A072UNJ4_MEDTR|nr:wuschel homeobox protein [Medicago truncatula]
MAPRKKVHWPSRFIKSTSDEDRNPGPRPRWIPKPEQIRILEAIYNSGMKNPPVDEIKKIREQLQEFGQIGDASVFYWFQNRKSKGKNKKAPYPKKSKRQPIADPALNNSLPQITTPPPNSSSSSSSNNIIGISNINDGTVMVPNSPAISLNQNQDDTYPDTLAETGLQLPTPPFPSFPVENHINERVVLNDMTTLEGSNYFSDFPNMIEPSPQQNVDLPLLNYDNIMNNENENGIYSVHDLFYQENIQEEAMNMMHMHQQDPQFNFGVTTTSSNDDSTDLAPLPPAIDMSAPVDVPFLFTGDQLQGFGEEDGMKKCRVFTTNEVIEVNAGPFNVRESFGNRAVLFDSFSTPVLTDEWGVTLNSLYHGADYYLSDGQLINKRLIAIIAKFNILSSLQLTYQHAVELILSKIAYS